MEFPESMDVQTTDRTNSVLEIWSESAFAVPGKIYISHLGAATLCIFFTKWTSNNELDTFTFPRSSHITNIYLNSVQLGEAHRVSAKRTLNLVDWDFLDSSWKTQFSLSGNILVLSQNSLKWSNRRMKIPNFTWWSIGKEKRGKWKQIFQYSTM